MFYIYNFYEIIQLETNGYCMEKETRAIILAAGKGTRMVSEKPKVLHEIFTKPLLGWVVEAIQRMSPQTQCVVVTGHNAQEVDAYLNKNYKYVKTVLQKEQLGTGHAVAQAVPMLVDFRGNIIIACGDTPLLSTKTLKSLVKFHNENESDLTVLSAEMPNPTGYGRIIRSVNNEVLKIIEEKDASELQREIKEVNAGVYCLNWAKIKDAFRELKNNNAQNEYYLTDIIKWARLKQLKVLCYKTQNGHEIFGINSRQNLATATEIMKDKYLDYLMTKGITIVDPRTTYISPETVIAPDTTIFPNTYIEGKNSIAKNCKIGPMARLRGNCEVGEGCKIGNFVELKNAKIAKNSNVCHLTYIGDAEIGSNVNVGAGTIFANYDSITKQKQKSIVRDGASIGSNSVIIAPVEIKEDAYVAALTGVSKNVESSSLVLSRSPQKEIKNWVKSKKGEK